MRKNKKGFIVLLIAVIAVFVTGTVMTTYAWFLSRYSHQYSIMLESESPIIIKYESDLVFGSEGAADNVLIPAKAKTLVGSEQQTLSPIDVFDTSLVGHPAQAVRITADGAYWAGSVSTQEPKIGLFRSDIYAYTASFLGGDVLSDHLEEFSDITAITEENLLSLLSAERSAYSSTPNSRVIARNNLVEKGELDAFIMIEYMGEIILCYEGAFYRSGLSTGADLTLPATVAQNEEPRYWHLLTADVDTYEDTDFVITDGSYLRMMPNTTFAMTLYVFMTKTDEELDPKINGETISLFVALTIQEE